MCQESRNLWYSRCIDAVILCICYQYDFRLLLNIVSSFNKISTAASVENIFGIKYGLFKILIVEIASWMLGVYSGVFTSFPYCLQQFVKLEDSIFADEARRLYVNVQFLTHSLEKYPSFRREEDMNETEWKWDSSKK